jgi:hypothetical protein
MDITLGLRGPSGPEGVVLDIDSARNITRIAVITRTPSKTSGRVRISVPPQIARVRFLNLLRPSSTKPKSRERERNSVVMNASIKIQDRPLAKAKISAASK